MQLGGNKKAKEYYTKNDMYLDGRPDHENPLLSKYKMALQKQALEELETFKATAAPVEQANKHENSKIEEENKKKPLTDENLASILKEKGYPIARRTVAKYREQLDIPVARLRKEI